jgi:hypothetical protein
MYSELLAELYSRTRPGEEGPVAADPLTMEVVRCRQRLRRHPGDPWRMTVNDLAFELDYDCHLLRLCAAMHVDHDPTRFEDGAHERLRLEGELRQRGIDLHLLDNDELPVGTDHVVTPSRSPHGEGCRQR